MKKILVFIFFLNCVPTFYAQKNNALAEKIREQYKIPELALAGVCSVSKFERQAYRYEPDKPHT